jgi:hypothetical protein
MTFQARPEERSEGSESVVGRGPGPGPKLSILVRRVDFEAAKMGGGLD